VILFECCGALTVQSAAMPERLELDGDVPFMMQVYPIREERRAMMIRGGDARRRLRPPADGLPPHQSALLPADRGVWRSHRRSNGIEYLVQ